MCAMSFRAYHPGNLPMSRRLFLIVVLSSIFLIVGKAPALESSGKSSEEWRVAAGALRSAIEDLSATFAREYPKGKEYLAQLARIERDLEVAPGPQRRELLAAFESLQREALVANPLVSGHLIVFVVRPQYRNDHHNTATMFQTGEINTGSFVGGGAIKTIDLADCRTVKTLVDAPAGIARDIDVRFDGKKILFSMRSNREDDYHLYEINADGSGFKQLTFGAPLSDIDPLYLPGGRVIFTSTREPKYCMCNRHIMGNLFTMDADGANIQQIGHSTLHEGHSSLLPDGRVIYDRWEYVDRNFGDAQGVWSVNPDGTNHAIYWGNNTNSPGAVLDARAIPGTPRFISTFSSCHDRPWGALAIVDPTLGMDGRVPVIRTWPADAIHFVGEGNYDTFTRVNPKYEDPYPLSDKYFLCSRMTGRGEEMGIYLFDLFGNEILLYAEAPGCYDPMPLAPRIAPPVIPPRVDLSRKEGSFYVTNVYIGKGMEKIKRGTAKHLRVVESPEKRFWSQPAWDGGTGQQAPAMAWDDFNNKRILGTVPIQADGSAYFSVPADRYVYFQLLDERGMMVQSMRSGTIARPGETTGCIGCHESRHMSIPHGAQLRTLQVGPAELTPWYGPPRLFSYRAEVQPALDKHCVSCHDYGKKAGEKLNLAGDLGVVFNTSYVELRRKGYIHVVGAGPFQVQQPKSWGSHASRLTKVLLEGHGKPEVDEKVHLDPESFDRIVTWIDINAPYYPEYAGGGFRDNPYGRSPLSGGELNRLKQLTDVDVMSPPAMVGVSFTRPEISPCLERIKDRNGPLYLEALAIIRTGRERLARFLRPDLPDFQSVSQIEIEQEELYQARLKLEAEMRAAMVQGEKRFSPEAKGQ